MTGSRPEPLHVEIARTLRERISHGVYAENEMLPPEMLLLAEFNVGRHTIREAMKVLVSEGLIQRSPGRGTVVSPRLAPRGSWGIKSLNDLIGEFSTAHSVLIKRGVVPVSDFPELGNSFGLAADDSLYHIQRVLHVNGQPAALHNLYTLVRYAERLPDAEIGKGSLILLIEKHCRVRAARTRQVASAVAAEAPATKLLGVRSGSPMLSLRRSYLTSTNELIESTELICRPDRYQHSVDFLRDFSPRTEKRSGQTNK
ncbi:GntR family transcriptional regulator [Caballeronia calidae]|uniref:GntR family transcriptional regulator n=1 Tax=Caballeronia calidae TaxID=1777139 RepID=A0A158ED88_9BURK|nr:GntR family transcriptional regulator [Caballeronia calidae]SAL04774.1 GntR family transcriptional regulator [Caballeronia calidae]